MSEVKVRTQAQLDRALARGDLPVIVSDGHFEIAGDVRVAISSSPSLVCWGSSSPSLVCWGSSSPSLDCRGSSSPSLVCRGSSSPSLDCRDSSSPSLVCRGSSSPSLDCWGSSSPSLDCWDSSSPSGRVGKYALVGVRVHGHGPRVDLPGSVALKTLDSDSTVEEWVDYHGVALEDGRLCVYKAVDQELRSGHRTRYEIGATVTCSDWQAHSSCGNGLHFSPHPRMARSYFRDATRFLACAVDPRTVVLLDDKLKAPSCEVLFEVDEDGGRVENEEGRPATAMAGARGQTAVGR